MPKQLLIYETAVPVSAGRHSGVSVEAGSTYQFSAGINAVPLMAVEFVPACAEYAVVFTRAGDQVMPAAVLGVRGDQNLYVSPEGQWKAKYIPAFIRRYPFVFSTSSDGRRLTLCIDEAHPGVNREGRGQKLFNEAGKPSGYVEHVLKFLEEYQAHFVRTQVFCKRVDDLGLLEPMQAQVTTPSGEKLSLTGFSAVNREKLRSLDGDALASLAKTDELEMLYLHLSSMRNFNEVKDRIVATLGAQPAKTEETVE